MMSLTFGLFTQVSGSGPLGPLVSSSFTYNQAEQIKKGVICVQILLELHLTEHSRSQGWTTFYTPVLVTPSRHMTSK